MCIKLNPVAFEILPFCIYILTPVVLALLELPVVALLWDACGIYCCFQLTFFNLNKRMTYQHTLGCKICCCFLLDSPDQRKMITCQPNLKSWEVPQFAWSMIWRMRWLGNSLNLFLHQKPLHCKGGVTRYIVMIQDPIVPPLLWPFLPNNIRQNSLFILQGQTRDHIYIIDGLPLHTWLLNVLYSWILTT